ncbi:MAG: prepilin peptidase [Candidatus Eremiobacteraeota bacterium]|nr:prepilin peptidase [Candidatus Eremiobacteraeota bacterium]
MGYLETPFLFKLIIAGIFGLIVGSFLNVCIYRIPRGMSIIVPGSACPECGHPLLWWENIPLISWLILKGRCRNCKEWISPRYFLVELLSGLIAVFLYWEYGGNLIQFLYYYSFSCMLLIIFFIDLAHWIIPDSVNITGIIIGISGGFLMPVGYSKFVVFHPEGGISSLAGAVAGYLFFALLAMAASFIVRQEAMGYGDVKFAALIGAFLGFTVKLFTGFILAFFLGGLFSLPFLLFKKKRGREPLPFGTFMAIAGFIAMVWGEHLVQWYVNFTGGFF